MFAISQPAEGTPYFVMLIYNLTDSSDHICSQLVPVMLVVKS